MTGSIDDLRRRGALLIVALLWFNMLAEAAIGAAVAAPDWAVAVAIGLAVNIAPTLALARRRIDGPTRLAIALAAAAHPAIMVFLLRSHPWQMDMHLHFLTMLAAVALLCDRRAVLVGALLVALHHLLLNLVAYDWVFAGGNGVGRVLMHAVILAGEAGLLIWLCEQLTRFVEGHDAARAANESATQAALAARAEAEAALAEAEHARATQEASEQREAERRRVEMNALAERFDASLTAVLASVSTAATQLGGSARSLADISADTSRQAGEVAGGAEAASQSAETVAVAADQLAASIAEIAGRVERQAALTADVRAMSAESDAAVQALATQASSIGEIIELIQSIAEQTNLLALNATIEAARAGAAGRGFAVVASEVKSLAAQTGRATADIASLVGGVQQRVGAAARSMSAVATKIAGVSEIAGAIADAVNEQQVATDEIGRNAGIAAAGTGRMRGGIGSVATAASAAGALSAQVQQSADDLATQASALRIAADDFIARLRAA